MDICSSLAAKHFGDDVSGLLKNAAVEAVLELESLSKSAESESVRARASDSILDKYFKHTKQEGPKDELDPKEEAEQLDQEIARLEEQSESLRNEHHSS